MIEIIPWMVMLLILYDLSIHFVYLIHKESFFLKNRLNWWPDWNRWDKKGRRRRYQIFWNTYWAIAFILMAMYLILK